MIPDKFLHAVEEIVGADPRFDRDAYLFVRDALEFTAKLHRRAPGRANAPQPAHHVSGQELLEGLRQYAIKEYGPMVPTVFEHWRVSRCEDFGAIVFNLIEAGVFGKNETDAREDFSGGYDFHEAFVEPFLPSGQHLRTVKPKV